MAEASSPTSRRSDTNLIEIVRAIVLNGVFKDVTKSSHGWVVLVVDDNAARILSCVAHMSDLTDCGISIIERLSLNRQPFPELSVIYLVSPTSEAIEQIGKDFPSEEKAKYGSAHLFFTAHAPENVMKQLEENRVMLNKLKALQELNIDFLAKEKSIFSLDMADAFRTLYHSSAASKLEKVERDLELIGEHLVSVCSTLQEYPYIRYKLDQPRMEKLAHIFHAKMNAYVANNSNFTYDPDRATILFIDRGQDLLAPFMHESTFQAMVMDLLDVEEDKITYPAETNSGTIMKTVFLNEQDTLWTEFRHTHIAKVSDEIGKRMTSLAASSAGLSSKKGHSTDINSLAATLRELPEYREVLGKLSQHLYLAGKSLEIFTATGLLEASNIEQTMATGVDESGKKSKANSLAKQLETVFGDSRLTDYDRARILAVFLLTQEDHVKEVEKRRILQLANLPIDYNHALANLKYLTRSELLYKQNSVALHSSDELKQASKKAETTEYSNARYTPKLKTWIEHALKYVLDDRDFPYIIAPPSKHGKVHSSEEDIKKKLGHISLRKKANKHGKDAVDKNEANGYSGERLIVFMLGGACYSELRSVYEVRASEKRDIIFGTTSFLKPRWFLDNLAHLHEEESPKKVDQDTVSSVQVQVQISSDTNDASNTIS